MGGGRLYDIILRLSGGFRIHKEKIENDHIMKAQLAMNFFHWFRDQSLFTGGGGGLVEMRNVMLIFFVPPFLSVQKCLPPPPLFPPPPLPVNKDRSLTLIRLNRQNKWYFLSYLQTS